MKVTPTGMASPVKPVSTQAQDSKVSFKDVMNRVDGGTLGKLQQELNTFTQGVMNGKVFSPKDLIVYQIKAGQFGLGVELVSKLAESVSSTVKKLEQGH